MNEDSITRIYCDVDDVCKALEGYCKTRFLPCRKAPKWFPAGRLSLSEVMTIIVLFTSQATAVSSGTTNGMSAFRCGTISLHRSVTTGLRN
jgi:hypothetical protein